MEDYQIERITQRDGGRCQYCGMQSQLEIYHIVDPQSNEYFEVSDDLLNQDDNLITLCGECHALILASLTKKRLLSKEEEEELKRIPGDLAQLQLSSSYSLPSPGKRMELRRRQQALLERQDQLRTLGRIRLERRQKEIIDLCERHLRGRPDDAA